MSETLNKSSRSASYPSLALEDALGRLTNMKTSIGVKGHFNRETVISAIGYNSVSGASARAVASLVHFGLLSREKDLYTLSELGQKYLMPTLDGQDTEAIREAALQPKLFKQIYDDYEGQVLPKQLNNILTIKHSIQNKAASSVVKAIESTFKFAGLLGENNILSSPNQQSVTSDADQNTDIKTQIQTPIPIKSIVKAEFDNSETAMSQRTVSRSGTGWALTVVFEQSRHFSPDIRKDIRALMDAAEDLSDKLYDIDVTPSDNK
jgi:hypothetical protein